MIKKEYVCIVCPNSCRLTVTDDDGEITVTGNSCKRGIEHGISEYKAPMRMLTTTVSLKNADIPRLSVISSAELPKSELFECLSELYKVEICAPVSCGDIIVRNIRNTGVDIRAAETVEAKERDL